VSGMIDRLVLSVVAFGLGWAYWTLVEYWIHRWLLHALPRGFWNRPHLRHHRRLASRLGTPAPAWVLGLNFALHYFAMRALWGDDFAIPHFAGFVTGGMAHEWIHYAIHWHPRWVPARNVAFHLSHHHGYSRARFGVTTELWDRVFDTVGRPPGEQRETAG
jgi:dihydroceramide fatty acyl 2-hydroxylase